jgi:hypothetical protein
MDTTQRLFFTIIFVGAVWLILSQFYGEKKYLSNAAGVIFDGITGG